MERHIKILGWLYIIGDGIALFIFLIASVIAAVVVSGFAVISMIIAIAAFIVLLPGVIGGYFLLKQKNWARILLLILAAIQLPVFPAGTVLGIYTIWVLLQKGIISLFSPPPSDNIHPRIAGESSTPESPKGYRQTLIPAKTRARSSIKDIILFIGLILVLAVVILIFYQIAPYQGLIEYRRILHSHDPVEREQAIKEIGRLRFGRYRYNPVLNLRDRDGDVRDAAAWALGEIKDVRATEHLVSVFLQDIGNVSRRTVAEALRRLGDHEAIELMVPALKDDREDVRLYAEEILRGLAGKDYVKNELSYDVYMLAGVVRKVKYLSRIQVSTRCGGMPQDIFDLTIEIAELGPLMEKRALPSQYRIGDILKVRIRLDMVSTHDQPRVQEGDIVKGEVYREIYGHDMLIRSINSTPYESANERCVREMINKPGPKGRPKP